MFSYEYITSVSYHVSKTIYLPFYLQGIKQHNPAAYVLNKTLPKHRLQAAAGTTATTKADSVTPNTDAVTVCYNVYTCVS